MEKQEVTVYRPNMRFEMSFIQIWFTLGKNVSKSRNLVWQLFKRDFLAIYKKSFLGITWVFIGPIIAVFSWVFLQSTGVLVPGDVGVPYPVYVLIGSSIWTLFLGAFSSSSNTLLAGSSFILQVNYPHEVLLFKQLAENLANFTISMTFNILILFWYGVTPAWQIIFLPFLLFPLVLLASALGLGVSIFSVVAIDIGKIFTIILGLLLYASPIVYSSEISHPLLRKIVALNPLTYLICSSRDMILFGRFYDGDWRAFLIASVFCVVVFLFSWRIFYLAEDKVIERMI